MSQRHGGDRHVPLLARRAQPAPRERPLEHARQLRRPADGLPAARRAARLDRGHPGVRPGGVVPLRLPGLPRVVAAGPRRRAGASSAPSRRTSRGSTSSSRCCRRRRGAMPRSSCRGCCTSGSATSNCSGGSTTACGRGSIRSPSWPVRIISGTRGSSSATGSTPPRRPTIPALARTDAALVATAYHAHTARLLARAADVLGHDKDRARYDELADHVVAAFNREFVTPSGRLASDAQTAYALALRFDLLPTRIAAHAGRRPTRRARAPRRATASAPASSEPRSSATRWSTAGSSTTPTTCCCRPSVRRGSTRSRWARRRCGSAGTA